jgi:regulator of sirC expression with transglutaminase-like and TPR domain
MSEITTDWTRQEFKAYLLTYAAKANYFESEEETELILSLVSNDAYKRIHKEFDKDNDYQSIQKILYNIEKFNYSKDELHVLIEDIQKFFMADGEVDLLESNMMMSLKRLLD